jgi:HNH endonuclease
MAMALPRSASRLTAQRLREVLHYEPVTGIWTWLINRRGIAKTGTIAGGVSSRGYWRFKIDGHLYQSSRLAVLYMTGQWPAEEVDHKDGNPLNDRWNNLREATRSEQRQNVRRRRDSRNAYKGLIRRQRKTKTVWEARVKGKCVGTFDSEEKAYAAYCQKATEAFGQFARFE